ncbi:uncharacterized protein BCR38DRAFT_388809 [Pseudomassariella vexata]|uniref:6-phosphogluconate dehydrogenase NADP-binding domain-containing protein n=1 Tax=Pseudomassariella vexata TaxID=1141098 RepID=A0A1Y2E2L5_9PEZI|nr:uncharacterized protein BCR38DRAFT_388809 [Pseudomassariella vexata]ORY65783.1 hypothetical protein BCR38DRAFT_388809 [Pseudomassariella vexata]
MAPRVMWIGLGNIGRGACKRLVENGPLDKPLIVYNRTTSRAEELATKLPAGRVQVTESLLEGVAQADIIFSCVNNDATVEQTYHTIAEAGNIKGKLFVGFETIHPDTANKVSDFITAAGASFASSPVFGPPAAAEAGQLLAIPAGPKAAIDSLRPYLTGVISRGEIAFEDRPCGTALKMKIVGNTCVLNLACQLAELFTLAEKTEVGTEAAKKFVDLLFGGVYSGYAERMLSGTYWKEPPLGAANLGLKDATHALHLAEASGVQIQNVKTFQGYLQKVVKHMGDKGDIAGMYGVVRENSGLKFENEV